MRAKSLFFLFGLLIVAGIALYFGSLQNNKKYEDFLSLPPYRQLTEDYVIKEFQVGRKNTDPYNPNPASSDSELVTFHLIRKQPDDLTPGWYVLADLYTRPDGRDLGYSFQPWNSQLPEPGNSFAGSVTNKRSYWLVKADGAGNEEWMAYIQSLRSCNAANDAGSFAYCVSLIEKRQWADPAESDILSPASDPEMFDIWELGTLSGQQNISKYVQLFDSDGVSLGYTIFKRYMSDTDLQYLDLSQPITLVYAPRMYQQPENILVSYDFVIWSNYTVDSNGVAIQNRPLPEDTAGAPIYLVHGFISNKDKAMILEQFKDTACDIAQDYGAVNACQ